MRRLRLSVPAHVTGFWTIHHSSNLEETGSTGAGLTLRPRIVAVATPSVELKVRLNMQEPSLCVVEYMKKVYAERPRVVDINSPYQLGVGFGVSAAISILTAVSLESTREHASLGNALRTAHVAEVKCETGLGDVIAEVRGGGLVVRIKPGAPGVGEAVSYPIRDRVKVVAAVLSRRLDTPTMLRVYRDRIIKYGRECLEKLLKSPTLETFLDLARYFSLKTGMITEEVKPRLHPLDLGIKRGEVLGYYLKKNVLLAVVDKSATYRVKRELEETLMCTTATCEIEKEGLKVKEG